MTDFRALCVELTDCLEKADWPHRYKGVFQQWTDIAHAALAKPEPNWPTRRQLLQLAAEFWPEGCEPAQSVPYARAVLARWGNHPGSPDSSTEPS